MVIDVVPVTGSFDDIGCGSKKDTLDYGGVDFIFPRKPTSFFRRQEELEETERRPTLLCCGNKGKKGN